MKTTGYLGLLAPTGSYVIHIQDMGKITKQVIKRILPWAVRIVFPAIGQPSGRLVSL